MIKYTNDDIYQHEDDVDLYGVKATEWLYQRGLFRFEGAPNRSVRRFCNAMTNELHSWMHVLDRKLENPES